MGKPQAKKRELPKRESAVIKAKVQKKKPRGGKKNGNGAVHKAKVVKSTKAALVDLVKRNGKVPQELPKQGRYVLAPPKTPSEPSGDSDSEDENYVDQFFDTVDEGDQEGMAESNSSDESEPSEEDEEDSGEEEEEEGEEEEEDIQHQIKTLLQQIQEEPESDSSDDYDFQFSPSEVVLDPDVMMDDSTGDSFEFNFDDGEEIEIDSYSETSSSSCCSQSHTSDDEEETSYDDSQEDEFVEGNGRFLSVDQSKIQFPSDGPAIVELENDSDECPELVPIPESFKNAPPPKTTTTAQQSKPKATAKKAAVAKEAVPVQDSVAPELADLDCYLSQDYSSVLVHLKGSFFFHGLLSIRVIAGAIELLHHTRRAGDSTEEIIAMATTDDYPVHVSTLPQPSSALTRGLADSAIQKFHHSHLMEIKTTFEDSHAVLLLKSVDETHLKFMQGHMSKKVLPEDFRKTFESILKCNFYRTHPKQFSPIPNDLLDQPASSSFPRIITVGGKNTGKSTFNKCLVNSLLSGNERAILYVDLDIGQPEFGVPQTVSAYLLKSPMIGKGFLKCHTADPYYSLVYGHCNVALDAIRYAKCVKALFGRLNSDCHLTPIPWVVNTMGYVRGVGLDLMHFIMTQLRPTRVFQFRHPQHHLENFPVKLDAEFMHRHETTVLPNDVSMHWEFEWQPVQGFSGNRSEDVRQLKGSEGRQMNLLSHLGLAMSRDFATTLNEVDAIW